MSKELVDWIKSQEAQGYSEDQLRNYLLTQGYPSKDIEESLDFVLPKKSKFSLSNSIKSVPKIYIILFLVIIVLLLTYSAFAQISRNSFCGGDGSEINPYKICSWKQLNNVRFHLSSNYILVENLSLSDIDYAGVGDNWKPIGSYAKTSNDDIILSKMFTGNFEGSDNTISDLIINSTSSGNVGLFGYSSGNISNIGLINVNVYSIGITGGLVGVEYDGTIINSYSTGQFNGYTVGGLVGSQHSKGVIINSYSKGKIIGSEEIGGLVGSSYGNISNSYFVGDIIGMERPTEIGSIVNPYALLGGLAGFSEGIIVNSYSSGNILSYSDQVGGLVGNSRGSILNSSSSMNVRGITYVGGLVGLKEAGLISNSYSIGNVTGSNSVGGLVGSSSGNISNSYSTGNINGSDRVGGLIGSCSKMIFNSYAKGTVTGNSNVGGLVGVQIGGIINNSYTLGNVFGKNENIGGLVGSQQSKQIYNFSSKSYDSQKALLSNSYSVGNVKGVNNVGGLIGLHEGNAIIEGANSSGNIQGVSSVGGLIGKQNSGDVSNSFATGNITIMLEPIRDIYGNIIEILEIGGFIGSMNGGTIDASYSLGDVSGDNAISYYLGGFVGHQNGGNISNSYSQGDVSGYDIIGGFSGGIDGGKIQHCYSLGRDSGIVSSRGFLGHFFYQTSAVNVDPNGTMTTFWNEISNVSDSFWDIETSGDSYSYGGIGKTTAEMKTSSTFVGWDFEKTWIILPDSYPTLRFSPRKIIHIRDVRKINYTSTQIDNFVELVEPIEVVPTTELEWTNQGYSLHQAGLNEKALESYNEAIKLNSENANSWLGKALVLADLQKYDEAILSFDEAIRLNPAFFIAWEEKGLMLSDIGKLEESKICFEKAREIESNVK